MKRCDVNTAGGISVNSADSLLPRTKDKYNHQQERTTCVNSSPYCLPHPLLPSQIVWNNRHHIRRERFSDALLVLLGCPLYVISMLSFFLILLGKCLPSALQLCLFPSAFLLSISKAGETKLSTGSIFRSVVLYLMTHEKHMPLSEESTQDLEEGIWSTSREEISFPVSASFWCVASFQEVIFLFPIIP